MKPIISILLFFITGNCLTAQVTVQNNGIAYISTSADIVFINGSFTNASGAALTNNGLLYVSQDISNDQASMATGTGVLHLNGSSGQTINGSQTFKTFDLVSNNASGITLNNNLSVSGAHNFAAGMITTSATPNYMIYESGASYTGDTDSRHINGWVKKIGSTDFIFPVGNAVYERTIALTSLTASAEFNIKHHGAATPYLNQLFSPLVYIDTSEYWTINKISGAAARVTMNWDNSKIPFPMLMVSDIRAVYFDGSFWRSIGGSATGNMLTTGTVTSNSVSAFNNYFVIGSVSLVLPLRIIDFTAVRMNGYSTINWTIANELNVRNYDLQRSDDAVHFFSISARTPFNHYGTESYNTEDRLPLNGVAYYRLHIMNDNGSVNYSDIVRVSEMANDKDLYVMTNPVDAGIDIFASNAVKGLYNYTIVNNAGQMMQSGSLDIITAGIYTIKLKSVFSTGTYILTVKNATHSLQKTILKK